MKPSHTIEKLVDEHKVILDCLFIEFPEIPLPQAHKPIQEFKHERCIGVTLGHRHNVNVLMFDMAEGGRAQGEDGRAYLGIGDDLYAEYVCKAWSAVIAKCTEDEVLAFLVEDEDAGKHVRQTSVPEGEWDN